MQHKKEIEREEQERIMEEEMRVRHKAQLQEDLKAWEKRNKGDNQSDDEEEQNQVELEEDSGLKNYFKEIVKNANRFGEKIDLTQYKGFL